MRIYVLESSLLKMIFFFFSNFKPTQNQIIIFIYIVSIFYMYIRGSNLFSFALLHRKLYKVSVVQSLLFG